MRHWRVGTASFGLFLIFLGVTLLVGQFSVALSEKLAMNCWPFLLLVLGAELIFSQYVFLRKPESKVSFDFSSLVFVGIIGLASLGVYGLQTSGFLGHLTEAAGGRVYPLSHQVVFASGAQANEILLDCDSFRHGQIRVWNADDGRVRVKTQGFSHSRESTERDLAAVATIDRIGKVVYIRLRSLSHDSLWGSRPDQVDILIPAGYRLMAQEQENLDISQFSGTVAWSNGRP